MRAISWVLLASGSGNTAAAAESDWVTVNIQRKPVNSTNVRSVGYHRGARVLEVEFKVGSVYRYREVPLDAYEALMHAESKGRHFSRNIRGQYEFRRTDRPRR
jgi:hypothetical protein